MSVLILRDRFSTVDTIPIRLDISLQTAYYVFRESDCDREVDR